MKKIIAILLAAVLAVPAVSALPVDKKTEKQLRKECKQKTKQLKKAGWEILGSSRTLEGALNNHYDQLIQQGDDAVEIYGTSTRVKSKNVGIQMATTNACTNYAQMQGSKLRGRITSEIAANADDTNMEFDKFYAAYERTVEKEIRGEMRPSYQLVRSNKDGSYEVEIYYIISESAASRARIRAMEDALAESQAAQKYAEQISKFVNDGFKDEE